MNKKNIFKLASALGGVLLILGCGGAGTRGTTADVATISDLPAATGPVTSATGSLMSGLVSGDLSALASTGMSLESTTSSSFNSSSSLAACEMFNMTKQSINQAAMGDLILCYVQNTFEAAVTAGLTNSLGNTIDIYDGSYHIFSLDFTGAAMEEGGSCPSKVKMKLTKSGGVITSFEMFSCCNNAQDQYLLQTIGGTTFGMTAVNASSQGTTSWADSTTVSGTLNSSGRFIDTKGIDMSMTWTDTGTTPDDTFYGVFSFDQGPSSATMNGVMSGAFTQADQQFTFANQVAGAVQLLDANLSTGQYDIGKLALGDGSVTGCSQGTSSGSLTLATTCTDGTQNSLSWTDAFGESWNGDTRAPLSAAADGSFFSQVNGALLPTNSQPTIAFSGSTAWANCGDATLNPAEATISFATLNVNLTSCNNYQLSHQHIDCWHLAGAAAPEVNQTACPGTAVCADNFSCQQFADNQIAANSPVCSNVTSVSCMTCVSGCCQVTQ